VTLLGVRALAVFQLGRSTSSPSLVRAMGIRSYRRNLPNRSSRDQFTIPATPHSGAQSGNPADPSSGWQTHKKRKFPDPVLAISCEERSHCFQRTDSKHYGRLCPCFKESSPSPVSHCHAVDQGHHDRAESHAEFAFRVPALRNRRTAFIKTACVVVGKKLAPYSLTVGPGRS